MNELVNKNTLIEKLNISKGKLPKTKISMVIEMFISISNIIKYDDRERNIREYLKSEVLINDLNKVIVESQYEIKKLKQNQFQLVNETVIQKRNDGDIFRWLKSFKKKDLDMLRKLVDIENEYRIVDREKFKESKFNKEGKSYGMMNGLNDVSKYV